MYLVPFEFNIKLRSGGLFTSCVEPFSLGFAWSSGILKSVAAITYGELLGFVISIQLAVAFTRLI